jgi:hypothetical protein
MAELVDGAVDSGCGRARTSRRPVSGSPEHERLERLPPKDKSAPIVDLLIDTWESVEREPNWGLDPRDLPRAGRAPRLDQKLLKPDS